MVIAQVVLSQTPEMAFIEHDHMIEQFVAEASNPAFSHSVLPRTSVARPHGRNSAGVQEIEHCGAKLRIAIEDEVLVVGTVGERLAELLYDPFTSGMLGAIEMEDLPAVVTDQKQAVQNAEVGRDHGEEIHSGDDLLVILQECPPCLRWRLRVPNHVFANGGFRDLDSQLR